MESLRINVDDTLQTIAEDIGSFHSTLYDEVCLFVLVSNASNQILLTKPDLSAKLASLNDVPNIGLIIGEARAKSSLKQVVQDLISHQHNLTLGTVRVLFTGPVPEEITTLNIVVGSRVDTRSEQSILWLAGQEVLRPNFSTQQLGIDGAKNLTRSLKRHADPSKHMAPRPMNSQVRDMPASRALVPWSNDRAESTPGRKTGRSSQPTPMSATLIVHRRPNATVRRTLIIHPSDQVIQRTDHPTPFGRIQELGDTDWTPKERFGIPARKIGGVRHVQATHTRRNKKETVATGGGTKMLKSAYKAFKGLPRVGGGGV